MTVHAILSACLAAVFVSHAWNCAVMVGNLYPLLNASFCSPPRCVYCRLIADICDIGANLNRKNSRANLNVQRKAKRPMKWKTNRIRMKKSGKTAIMNRTQTPNLNKSKHRGDHLRLRKIRQTNMYISTLTVYVHSHAHTGRWVHGY